MAKPRVKVPSKVKKGETFEVKCLVSHVMESGQRKDRKTGEIIPRMIINKFVATYNGEEVFSADWHPAISANPFMSFFMKVEESGELTLTWIDDNGEKITTTKKIAVG
jgi:sulfur-oxidizing protein SoxZ